MIIFLHVLFKVLEIDVFKIILMNVPKGWRVLNNPEEFSSHEKKDNSNQRIYSRIIVCRYFKYLQ